MREALSKHRKVAMWIYGIALSVTVGCGQEASVPTGDDAEQIRQLAVAYMRYMTSHQGRAPQSESEFRKHLSSLGYDEAKIDSMLVSPRDGQPYKIAYNARITGSHPVVVAYEQTGVGGDRYVAFDFGGVEIADPEQFEKLLNPPASQ